MIGASAIPTSMTDEIIGGPHDTVGAGGVDFHVLAGELVEEKGSAPGVYEFAIAIHLQAGVGLDEIEVARVVTHQGGGDFGIVADGVFAELGIITVDDAVHAFQNSGGGLWCIGISHGRGYDAGLGGEVTWRTGGWRRNERRDNGGGGGRW